MPPPLLALALSLAVLALASPASAHLSALPIRGVIHRNLPEVRGCYERALMARPVLHGTLAVHFTIDHAGAVTQAEVSRDELGRPDLAACILAAVRTWTFPAAPHGTISVTYPFRCEPAE